MIIVNVIRNYLWFNALKICYEHIEVLVKMYLSMENLTSYQIQIHDEWYKRCLFWLLIIMSIVFKSRRKENKKMKRLKKELGKMESTAMIFLKGFYRIMYI